jgi:hypothetical protein
MVCEIDWSAIASFTNAALVLWLILVTIRYVRANERLVKINDASLEELKQQRQASGDREKRPFRTSLVLLIRTLEHFRDEDLTALYESRDLGRRPSERQITPPSFQAAIPKLTEIDPDLHGDFNRLDSQVLHQARVKMNEMEHLAGQGLATIRPEIQRLEQEFKEIVVRAISLANGVLVRLEEAQW